MDAPRSFCPKDKHGTKKHTKNADRAPASSFEILLFLFQMTFYVSNRVTLLFDFWDVHGPVGECDTACFNALQANGIVTKVYPGVLRDFFFKKETFSYIPLQHSLH